MIFGRDDQLQQQGDILMGAQHGDMNVLTRVGSTLLHFDVSQTGSICCRRGFRRAAVAPDGSIILSLIYSISDRYLIAVPCSAVLSVEDDVGFPFLPCRQAANVVTLRHKQVHRMLFLFCLSHELTVPKRDNDGTFPTLSCHLKRRPTCHEETKTSPSG